MGILVVVKKNVLGTKHILLKTKQTNVNPSTIITIGANVNNRLFQITRLANSQYVFPRKNMFKGQTCLHNIIMNARRFRFTHW